MQDIGSLQLGGSVVQGLGWVTLPALEPIGVAWDRAGAGWQRPGTECTSLRSQARDPRKKSGRCPQEKEGGCRTAQTPACFQLPPSSVGPHACAHLTSMGVEPSRGPWPSLLGQACAWRQRQL